MAPHADLAARLRALLADEPSTREVSMFGGRAFMVDDRLVVSAGRTGELLVRVPRERHEELVRRPGARQAVMGTDRDMGPGWLTVIAASDEDLTFWLEVALAHNRSARRHGGEG